MSKLDRQTHDSVEIVESLELQLAACRRELDDSRQQSARVLEEISQARKDTEETLQETKATLELALKSAQIGTWDLDLVHDTSRRSLRHDQCFGYEASIPEAGWGIAHFLKHVHPDDRAQVEGSLRDAVRDLVDWSSEFRVVWPDGTVHWLDARGSIYRTSRAKATRMLGTVTDVTERKRADEALRAYERHSRGQVALKSTLDVLAMEPAPDRLVGHILRTITEQFGAHSCSAWRRDDASARIGFEYAFEDGEAVSKDHPRFSGLDLWLPMADAWPWTEVVRTGESCLIEDIRTVQPFALRDRLLPLGIVTVLLVPMSIAGRLEGVIGMRFKQKRVFQSEQLDLARALANQAILMLQFARLSVRDREAAILEERNRIARNIHDTLAQGFTGVIVQLEAAEDARHKRLAEEADEHVSRASELARESLNEARRSVQALRPRALAENNLSGALESLFREMTRGTCLRSDFTLVGEPRSLPATWEEDLFHIGQEILTNALRHAAAGQFTATLAFLPDLIRLDARDDGRGFDPSLKSDGCGLLGIQERVEAMGGHFSVQSAAGEGTSIAIVLAAAQQPAGAAR